jgi:hypothetical protein
MEVAYSLYLGDFSKSLPYYPTDPTYYGTLWMGTLIRYHAQVNQVRLCPAALDKNPRPSTGNWGTADADWVWTSDPVLTGSYCFNGWFYSDDQYFTTGDDLVRHFNKDTNVPLPTLTLVFADSVWVDFWPRPTDSPADNLYIGDESQGIGKIGRCTIPRHGDRPASSAPQSFPHGRRLPGSIDLAFFDGRVENVPLELLWNYYWYNGWLVPSPRPP